MVACPECEGLRLSGMERASDGDSPSKIQSRSDSSREPE
jgi:hypothetical protein